MFRTWMTALWTTRKRLRLTWSLLNDNRIPLWQKTIPFLPLIYILSPFNFLTFAVPLLGQVEDVALIVLALDLFERVIDENVLSDHNVSVKDVI